MAFFDTLHALKSLDRLEQARVLDGIAATLRRLPYRMTPVGYVAEMARDLRRGGAETLSQRQLELLRAVGGAVERAEALPPYAARLMTPVPLGRRPSKDLLEEHARVAARIWRSASIDEGRQIFERWFYPFGPAARIADLATGRGDHALTLARLYPGSRVFAVDSRKITALEDAGVLANVVNYGSTTAEQFLDRVVRAGGEFPIDRVYVVMPDPPDIPALVGPAIQMVGDEGEIHLLIERRPYSLDVRSLLESAGFEVSGVSIPPEVAPATEFIDEFRGVYRQFLWLVARRRRPQNFVLPAPLEVRRDIPFPRQFEIQGLPIKGLLDLYAETLLSELFGLPIPLDELLTALSPPAGFRMAELRVRAPFGSTVVIEGYVADQKGQPAGHFAWSIPKAPRPGEPWVAEFKKFYSEAGDHWNHTGPNHDHRQEGLARAHLQAMLPFLARLGVDRVRLEATYDGAYAWARLGFDFETPEARLKLKVEFLNWIRGQKIPLSARKEEEVLWIERAGELADFVDEGGRPIGREFLLYRGHAIVMGWRAHFNLRRDFHGWWRLFIRTRPGWLEEAADRGRQLALSLEEKLAPTVGLFLSSDEEVERIPQLAITPALEDLEGLVVDSLGISGGRGRPGWPDGETPRVLLIGPGLSKTDPLYAARFLGKIMARSRRSGLLSVHDINPNPLIRRYYDSLDFRPHRLDLNLGGPGSYRSYPGPPVHLVLAFHPGGDPIDLVNFVKRRVAPGGVVILQHSQGSEGPVGTTRVMTPALERFLGHFRPEFGELLPVSVTPWFETAWSRNQRFGSLFTAFLQRQTEP